MYERDSVYMRESVCERERDEKEEETVRDQGE